METIEQKLQEAVRIHREAGAVQGEELYRHVLKDHPRYAAAWEHLGHALAEQGRLNEALQSYARVLELDPNHASALNNLGNVYEKLGRRQEALASFDRAIAIQPGLIAARLNKAFTLLLAGQIEAALREYESAVAHDPKNPQLHKNVGLARLMVGNFAGGWPEHEWRYQAGDPVLPQLGRPLWDGSSLYGRTIMLVSEPGLGDDVHFIRYAAWLKQRYQCHTLFCCRPPLRALLATCPGIDGWVDDVPPHLLPPFDFFAPLMRIPAALAHTPREFPVDVPYLTADAVLVEQWKQRLAAYRGRKIGIHWRASPTHRTGHLRSIPIAEFGRLASLPDVQLFSLQKGPGAEEVKTLADVIDLGMELDETTGAFVETAAVLKNLDLLITCDTAIAHVAGALGVPVWLALCHLPDWRWGLTGETTVWYPTMRLFRQSTPGDWSSVIQWIADEIKTLTLE